MGAPAGSTESYHVKQENTERHFMNSNRFLSNAAKGSALALLMAAMPGSAATILASMEQSTTDAISGTSAVSNYVDWSSNTTTAGHVNYGTWTDPWANTTKYFNYNIVSLNSGLTGQCLQIQAIDLTNLSADPMIWVKTTNGVWTLLSDDRFGRLPYARIYAYEGFWTTQFGRIRVSAFNHDHNSEAFRFRSNWTTNDYNTCMSGDDAAAYVPSNGIPIVVKVF
jgi:hypothetical protein